MIRHAPQPTAETAPFWDGARRGALVLPHCDACRRFLWPPAGRCPTCRGALSWRAAAGGGTLHAHAIVRRAPHPDLEGEVPYVVALVDLDAGIRLFANLMDSAAEETAAGLRVRVDFRPVEGSDAALPVFVPDRAAR